MDAESNHQALTTMTTHLHLFFLLIAFSGCLLAQEWNLALAWPGSPVAITAPAKHTISFGTTQVRNQRV